MKTIMKQDLHWLAALAALALATTTSSVARAQEATPSAPTADGGVPPASADAAVPPPAAAPLPAPPPAPPEPPTTPAAVPDATPSQTQPSTPPVYESPSIPQPTAAGEATTPPAATTPTDYRATAIAPGLFVSSDLAAAPTNAQHIDGSWIRDQHGVGLNQSLNARLGSVTVNDVQNNPLQPDLQYRGFTLSPLLGTPQGLAVYQNGVRINEPFGDLLQWDLLPTFALEDVQLIPGASPMYGLNALGGSLVLRMKDGFSAPGTRVEVLGGSFARYQGSLEVGRTWGEWAAYAGVSVFGERGYRDHSPASAQNLYADLRRRTARNELGISATLASSDLNGNGPAPIELLQEDDFAVFTWPDTTQNQLWMVNLDGRQALSRTTTLLGGAYVRHGSRDTINGDAGEFSLCPDDDGTSLLCSEDGEPLLDETGSTIPTEVLPNAAFNTTGTSSDGLGASLQLEVREEIASRPNRLLGGVSYDGSHIEFSQRVEVGRLTTDRTVQGEGFYLAGAGNRTALHVQSHNVGVFVSDTLTITDPLSLQVSARLNWYDTKMDDRQGDALDGHHSFVRLNPSIGLTYQVIDPLTVFASYGEANRAPSASELACADPDEPCRLPNAFVADPPLDQVVSRSVELGVRARLGDGPRPWLEASLAAFGARNQDDILFIAGSRVGTGYFQNAGDTQRIGLELALAIDRGPVTFYASYSILRATFESELELPGDANPRATPNEEEEAGEQEEGEEDEGGRTLEVAKGSRIPGLPTHSVKAGVSVRPIAGLEIGVSTLGQSNQPFRGDEANLLAGVNGYVVLNAHASYRLLEPLTLFVRAQNLLDTRYSTFGVLGDPDEALPGTSNPRFLGRAAPFGLWIGAVVETL